MAFGLLENRGEEEETMHKTLIVLLSAGIILGACAKQNFRIASRAGVVGEEATSHFFIRGIGQNDEINAASICGSGARVANVETSYSGVNVLLRLFTLGLYAPRTYRVSCTR